VTDASFKLISHDLGNWSYSVLLGMFSHPLTVLQLLINNFLINE